MYYFGRVGEACFCDSKSNAPIYSCDGNYFSGESDLPGLVRLYLS